MTPGAKAHVARKGIQRDEASQAEASGYPRMHASFDLFRRTRYNGELEELTDWKVWRRRNGGFG